MSKKPLGFLFALAVLTLALPAFPQADEKKPDPLEKQQAAIKAVQPALVIVEYTLQYDKGQAPGGSAGRYRNSAYADIIKEERPLEQSGVLVDDTHVATQDLLIHPRFIKSIAVRKVGGSRVDAKISAVAKVQNGIILELSAALKDAKPIKCDPALAGPYSAVTYFESNGDWVATTSPFGLELAVGTDRKDYRLHQGVVVDKAGAPVAVVFDDELPADDSWKGSPLQWPAYSADQLKTMLDTLDKQAGQTLVRVTLNFRSPKNNAASGYRRGDDESNAAVMNVLGVVMNPNTVLVLAELKPTVTSRLESIRVFTDPPVDAKFKATLTDFGAFVATPEKPLTALVASTQKLPDLLGVAIPGVEVLMQGEHRVAYVQHRRMTGLSVGWQKNLFIEISDASKGLFLFDADNKLVALPISHREKVAVEERYGSSDRSMITPIALINTALSDLAKSSDPSNVPLSEEQENRLAWIGVELQPLNQELARANNVSDLTNDGEMGALVTYVYPDSPAAKAGVEPGWVFLRIDAEGQPKPIDLHIESDSFRDRPFPWDRLGEAPESVFDRIPTPWAPAENALIRTLTDLGFGKKFTGEFFSDGKNIKKDFVVTQSPSHFLSAPKFKNVALGLTVRDLTYEVRRYLQKKTDEPGVVISKIEMGSKASVSGLKPYELITAVNDQPVNSVKDFEALTKDQEELRLTIKRMTKGRIVKIKLTAAAATETQPAATAPAEKPAT